MEVQFTVTEAWLDEHFIDFDVFMAALAENCPDAVEPQLDANDNAYWLVTGVDIDPANSIPDFLEALFNNPIVNKPSVGGDGT